MIKETQTEKKMIEEEKEGMKIKAEIQKAITTSKEKTILTPTLGQEITNQDKIGGKKLMKGENTEGEKLEGNSPNKPRDPTMSPSTAKKRDRM